MSVYRWNDLPEEKVSNLVSRKIISGEKVMLAHLILKKGCEVPVHKHVHEQFSSIVKGALRFKLAGKELIVKEGEVLHIPSNVEHGATALKDTIALDVFAPVREDWLTGKDDYLRRAVLKDDR